MTKRLTLAVRTLVGGLAVAAVALVMSAPCAAQSANRIRKDIEKLQKKLDKVQRDIEKANSALEKKKSQVKKSFDVAHNRDFHAEVGAELATIVARHAANGSAGNGHRATAAFKEIAPFLRKRIGREVLEVIERNLRDILVALIDEADEADADRCERDFRLAVDDALPSDFEQAWNKKLLPLCSRKLTRLEEAKAKLEREIDGLRARLTGNVRGRIPPGMVVVPASEGEHGWSREDIERLSKADRSTVERNIFLFLGTGRVHRKVPAFMIDRTEVTHLQYWYFCKETGHEAPHYFVQDPRRKDKRKRIDVWPEGKIPEGWNDRPVTYVSLEDAMDYATWIGARLPTEDEWEAAARTGKHGWDGRFWAWGNEYKEELCNDSLAQTTRKKLGVDAIVPDGIDLPAVVPVGTFKEGASPLGIFDLNGNVAEWTTSPFRPYRTFSEVQVGKKSLTPSAFDAEKVVVRGGHCAHRNLIVASAMRIGVHPFSRRKYIGFRCARSAVPGKDRLAFLTADHKLDARLVDFAKLKGDEKDKSEPRIDQSEGSYATLEKFDFNQELGVRGKAHAILIANRLQNEITSEKQLRELSDGDEDLSGSTLLGLLYTDAEFVKPALKPGLYFVAFKQGRTYKDPETKEKVVIKDAYLFVPHRAGEPIVRLEDFGTSSVIVSKDSEETRLEVARSADRDVVTCIWSFGMRARRGSFQVILELEAKPGALADFE